MDINSWLKIKMVDSASLDNKWMKSGSGVLNLEGSYLGGSIKMDTVVELLERFYIKRKT